jgi:DNA-binding response OmpR family regulator
METFDLAPGPDRSRDERVLIMAPVGRDAAMTARFLAEAGLTSHICDDISSLCPEIHHGCGLIFLTGEALTPEALRSLIDCATQQPPWSDVPLIVLTSGGGETPINADVLAALGKAGNVTLIERPVRAATLLSSIKSALRARRRQYDVRDHLIEQVRAREALGQSEEQLRIALDAAQLGTWQFDLASRRVESTPGHKAHFRPAAGRRVFLRVSYGGNSSRRPRTRSARCRNGLAGTHRLSLRIPYLVARQQRALDSGHGSCQLRQQRSGL